MKARQPAFREAFSQLIAAPSVSCLDPALDQSNRPVVDLLANWLSDRGFDIEIMPVSREPEKVNLIARVGDGPGGLVLSGHTDTVPFNADKWRQDPFVLTERDGRYYGLGTADMKSFFPLILDTLADQDLKKLKQPLFILATCDEESAMTGAKALMESGRRLGRHALIGEPTSLKPIYMHKGVMFETVRLTGRSGHSSDPARGINALEGMNSVINSLIRWRDELQAREANPAFQVPVPTMNFGRIHGGDNPNRICADCELTLDVRLLPHMDIETTRAELRRIVTETVDGTGMEVEFDCIFPGTPGMETDRHADIIRYAESLTGEAADSVAFATEGPYLNAMGMDTLVLGPGNIEQAHQADEYLELERIEPMKIIIQQIVGHFCLNGNP